MRPVAVAMAVPQARDWNGDDSPPSRVWAGSVGIVMAAHVAAIAVPLLWAAQAAPPEAPPAGAMMIELAPPASAPVPTVQPAPEPPRTEPKPTPRKLPPPTPKPPPVKRAEVALPAPPPVTPKAAAEVQPRQMDKATAAPASDAPPDRTTSAPERGMTSQPTGNAVPSWQGTLRAHLERHKRYPAAAAFRRQQGSPIIRFAMDREGKVVRSMIECSSGHAALDEEALAMLTRAQPLPPPPAELSGAIIELVVPVQFFLR
jgi:periplasmic protein TonB